MLEQGAMIGQYKVLQLLAHNKSSQVYLVYCNALKAKLVLKLCCVNDIRHKAQSSSLQLPVTEANIEPEHAGRFRQQALLMHEFASAKHIVTLMHIGQTNSNEQPANTPYIVMAHYAQDLAQWLALHHQVISAQTSLPLIKQILKALVSLHEKGVLHLDLKLQNLFVDAAGDVFLGDFDNAMLLASSVLQAKLPELSELSKKHHNQRITPEYASPEQIQYAKTPSKQSANALSEQSDLYSLGVVWLRLLSGKHHTSAAHLHSETEFLASLNVQAVANNTHDSYAKATQEHQHNVPAWMASLIWQLLQDTPSQRPQSAAYCLNLIADIELQAENMATQELSEDALLSTQSKRLKEDIIALLLSVGEISEQERLRLVLEYMETSGSSKQALLHDLSRFIEQIEQSLIKEQNLSAWFGWIHYLNVMLKSKGRRLSRTSYQQVLHVGRASRPNAPELAHNVMQLKFEQSGVGQALKGGMYVPLLLIVGVFMFLYWSTMFESKERLGEHSQIMTQSAFNDNKNAKSDTSLIEDSQSSVKGSENYSAVWQRGDEQNSELKNSNLPVHNASSDNTDVQKPSIIDLLRANEVVLITLPTTQNISNTHASEASNQAMFELKKPFDNANFAVMLTEVTQGLFQACIAQGACVKRKHYSTAKKANKDNLQHPQVNVSWYDIHDDFIEWLQQATNLRYSLPSYQQWRLLSEPMRSNNNVLYHCKDCRHSLAQAYAGGTIAVKSLPANSQGLFGVWGNAQEWLGDCWRENNIERCDQAIVAGGSWIDKRSSIEQNQVSQLLKRATSPTTGFRLIVQLDD